MKPISVAVFLIVITGCSNGNKHTDIKVKALHAWKNGRAKNCMLLTGRAAIQGIKAGPDPKEMWCADQLKTDPDHMNWDYIRIANVRLDDASQKMFNDTQRYGVPLVCEEVSSSELRCLSDDSK